MLERSTLWFSPSTPVWPPGLPPTAPLLRRVLSDDNRELVGHVAVTPARWWPWPAGRQIAVFEEPDASLLFRANGLGWLRRVIVVTEADGNAVAYAYGDRIARPVGGLIAIHRRARAGGAFLSPSGSELAGWQLSSSGIRVAFADELRNEPFVKM